MMLRQLIRSTGAVASWTLPLSLAQVLFVGAHLAAETEINASRFKPRNIEVPFCYLTGGTRSWQILRAPLSSVDEVGLTIVGAEGKSETGGRIEWRGLKIDLHRDGRLEIQADAASPPPQFELEIALPLDGGDSETQRLTIRPAPPPHPISYVSDFVDDLIHIFANATTGSFQTVDRDGLDQYFRRLQAQGVSRLIVWLGPFPYITKPADHRADDWSRYEQQAQAIIESHSERLGEPYKSGAGTAYHFKADQTRLTSWTWLAQLLALRLDPDFGRMLTDSAAEHGIKLTASFRPFEAAGTKYYEVPAFDGDGAYLWGFLPLAVPALNYHPENVGFAHCRTLLDLMGQGVAAEPATLELAGAARAAETASAFDRGDLRLSVVASHYPPIDPDSLVLVRDRDGSFALQEFKQIHQRADTRRVAVEGYRVEATGKSALRLSNLKAPAGYRYLIITNPADSPLIAAKDVRVVSQAGTPLGRLNAYWVFSDAVDKSRTTKLAGITPDGEFRSTFQTTSSSIDLVRDSPPPENFAGASLVVDLGRPYEVEMLDFEVPAARQLAVTQLKSLLSYPAFDEIFINTRTHTQLPGCMADGAEGIQTQRHYRERRQNYFHLGVDRAYAPRSLAHNNLLVEMSRSPEGREQITNWTAGEWQDDCDSGASPHIWRRERKRAIANGVRQLLVDIEREFPAVRVRVVVPPSDATIRQVREGLDKLPKADGEPYGRDYYEKIWASINHIPAIGEAMASADFSGLSVEPVFLGIRLAPDDQPLKLFLESCFDDLRENRGSTFRGPRSFFYEAQETLRGDEDEQEHLRRRREKIICTLLAQRKEINEVLLYEAADWTYLLPLSDPELCGHTFIENCAQQP